MNVLHTVESLRARIAGSIEALPGGSCEWRKPAPAIHCADGFRVSVQAGEHLYCEPRANGAAWTSVEMGFPSAPIPEFAEYRDGADDPDVGSVFGYVPIEKVVDLINEHGGEVQP